MKLRMASMAAVVLWPLAAGAQDAALDDKLRDLLHQSTTQLRAAEDSAATLQTQLDSMTKQRDELQQQLAAAAAKPAAPPPPPAAAIRQNDAELAAARAQNAQLAAGSQRWQAAYANAANIAREKDASDQRHAADLAQASRGFDACKAANTRLVELSTEILHLYETPKFKELLVANHERLLGFKRVQLENLVQDYDDKIDAATYVPAAPMPSP